MYVTSLITPSAYVFHQFGQWWIQRQAYFLGKSSLALIISNYFPLADISHKWSRRYREMTVFCHKLSSVTHTTIRAIMFCRKPKSWLYISGRTVLLVMIIYHSLCFRNLWRTFIHEYNPSLACMIERQCSTWGRAVTSASVIKTFISIPDWMRRIHIIFVNEYSKVEIIAVEFVSLLINHHRSRCLLSNCRLAVIWIIDDTHHCHIDIFGECQVYYCPPMSVLPQYYI